jgi:hypothetical protein
MKTGRTLLSLAEEVERQQKNKRDFVVKSPALEMTPEATLAISKIGEFPISEHAHNQIGLRLSIPAKYYDQMRASAPQLLATNVNHWLQNKPETRMVRTLDGRVRAYLSDSYQRRDNYDLLVGVLPLLKNSPTPLEVLSSEITERKMYLKVAAPRIVAAIKVGDPVQSGFIVSNSEVGVGSVSVMPFVNRLVCMNGMVIPEMGKRKYHVGRRIEESDEEARELFGDDTLKADDEAFFLKVRDIILACLTQERFELIVDRMRGAADRAITRMATDAVKELGKRYELNEGEQTLVLKHLVEDGVGLTQYGLAQAVSSAAGEAETYDKATEMETLAGEVITLAPSEWKVLAQAA